MQLVMQANNCSSAANSGTSTTSLIDLSTPLQSSIIPLESAQSLLPQSAHQPILAPFPKRTMASKHVPFVHLGTESTNGFALSRRKRHSTVLLLYDGRQARSGIAWKQR